MAHDPDPFVRWEAGQSYALKLMLALIADHRAGRALRLDGRRGVRRDARRPHLDHAFAPRR